MSKHEKIIQKILNGANVTPNEIMTILKAMGFKATPIGGSHLTFRKAGRHSITLVVTQNPVKRYILEKVQVALESEIYKND